MISVIKKYFMALLLLGLFSGQRAFAQYCAVTGYVDGRIHVSEIDWPAGQINLTNGGYQDLSAQDSLNVYAGFSYPFTIILPSTGSFPANVASFWVDWNKDFQFDSTSERVNMVSRDQGHTFKGTITPTANAVVGRTRLRLVVFYSTPTRNMNPCSSTVNNNDGSVIDLTISYRLAPTNVPACPNLIGPANGLTRAVNPVQFSWHPNNLTDAVTGYKLYLDTNSTFPNPAISVTDTTYTPTILLLGGKTYYWKVLATNGAGNSAGCAVRSLTMSNLTPGCPVVHYPHWGGPIVPKQFTFNWSSAGDNPDRYRVVLDTVYPPRQILADSVRTTTLASGTLKPGKRYYYTILAQNINGWSACPADSFITRDSTSWCSTTFVGGPYCVKKLKFANLSDSGITTSGYFDRRPKKATLKMGKKDTLIATISAQYGVTALNVYIDWNHNGQFTDLGDTIFTTRTAAIQTGYVTPPANALPGRTLMRLILVYLVNGRSMNPCGPHGYDGNAIDYWIDVVPGDSCNMKPMAGIAHIDSVDCTSGRNVISALGAAQAKCLKGRWQINSGQGWSSTPASDSGLVLRVLPGTTPQAYRYYVTTRDTLHKADSTLPVTVYPLSIPAPTVRDSSRCASGEFELSAGMVPPGVRPVWYKAATGNAADSLGGELFSRSRLLITHLNDGDSLVRYVAWQTPFGCIGARSRIVARSFGIPASPLLFYADTLSGCTGTPFVFNGPAGFSKYKWSTGDSTASITVSTQQSVTLQVANKYGCLSPVSNAIFVQELEKPAKPTISNISPDTLLANITPGNPGFTFVWLRNGQVIAAANSNKYHPLTTGDYRVFAVNKYNSFTCTGDTSAPQNVVVGIESQLKLASFEIVPNPATDNVSIRLPEGLNRNIYLLDALGRTVKVMDFQTANMGFSVTDLAKGIYTVKIEGFAARKLLVN